MTIYSFGCYEAPQLSNQAIYRKYTPLPEIIPEKLKPKTFNERLNILDEQVDHLRNLMIEKEKHP